MDQTVVRQLKELMPYIFLVVVLSIVGLNSEDIPSREERQCLDQAFQALDKEVERHQLIVERHKNEIVRGGLGLDEMAQLSKEIEENNRLIARSALSYDQAQIDCKAK